MPTVYATTGVITVASAAATGNQTGTFPIASGASGPAFLTGAVVDMNNLSTGPVWVEIHFAYGSVSNPNVLLAAGWIRGDAAFANSDSVTWTGHMPLNPNEQNRLIVLIRNDSGAAVAVAVGVVAGP